MAGESGHILSQRMTKVKKKSRVRDMAMAISKTPCTVKENRSIEIGRTARKSRRPYAPPLRAASTWSIQHLLRHKEKQSTLAHAKDNPRSPRGHSCNHIMAHGAAQLGQVSPRTPT